MEMRLILIHRQKPAHACLTTKGRRTHTHTYPKKKKKQRENRAKERKHVWPHSVMKPPYKEWTGLAHHLQERRFRR